MRGASESGSNQALKIGENAMIGIAFAAIAIGRSASPRRRKRARTTAKAIPRLEPITNPPRASFSVSQPALHKGWRCVQEAWTIAHGFGSRKRWMLKISIESCQTAIPAKNTRIAGIQSRRRDRTEALMRRLRPAPTRARRRRPRAGARARSVTCSKNRGSSRVSTLRGCSRSISTIPATRPGRGLMTTTRVERKTASEIECVTKTTVDSMRRQICSSSMFSRSRVISSSAPNGSSISRSGGSKASARAIATRICMPPESCHGWWSPKPSSSTRRSIWSTRSLRFVRSQPSISSGSATFFATVRQSKSTESWKTIPYSWSSRASVRALAVHLDGAGRRLDQIADQAQQRRLAAAGRADQRDELGRLDLQVDLLDCGDVPFREGLRQAVDRDDAHTRFDGARRTMSFSARTIARKNVMPSAAAIRFVAQRFAGTSE